MASNTAVKMDVDNPLVLKRSSSAPMINELNNSISSQTPTNALREPTLQLFTGVPRMRRFSASFSPLSGPSSPKLTPRVNQLRREESVDVIGREAAHERELNSTMVMSQSWEDLTLVADNPKECSDNGKLSPLSVSLPPLCSTPSPTRPASVPLRHSVFKPSLSPSPTRKFTTRRSQSPIAMRPSALGPVKRKFQLEENESPAKRFSGLLIQQARFEPVIKSPTIDSGLGGFDRLTQESAVPAAKGD
ncbi:P2R1A-PPP2R2A-interacting phosphatase regulator 1 [Halyomorpha halys]|uniref:P2R1A-PPP2R2A-interacting phosphatase regulator 1 n=1 Tax=Halyomorpha halys TaxID=286706 RepID=UPI0006D51E83|nr:protein FAM122A [Halyomorpha halys]